jgi:hypothetical protein
MAMEAAEEAYSYLPDEIWERIFKQKFLDSHTLKSLSVVSKQLLSITNRFRIFVVITYQTIPFLHRLFQRFPNLMIFDLSRLSKKLDQNAVLFQISILHRR